MTVLFPEVDPLLIETVDRALADTCDHSTIEAAETTGWSSAVWDALHEIGFTSISVPESAGGAGGTLLDALAVLYVAGRHGAPVPLAEATVLGGWLLAAGGFDLGSDVITVVGAGNRDDLHLDGDRLSGTARSVAWATRAGRLVGIVDGRVVVATPGTGVLITEATNLAGEPRSTVVFDGAAVQVAAAVAGVDARMLRLRGALARSVQMAGALGAMSDLSQQYTAERKQFGKPVGTFQAVQTHLVHMAQDAALVELAAATAGAKASANGIEACAFEIASAKLLANEAARTATASAHQAHGAMGMTREYRLHQFSRRLWSWRHEFGDTKYWSGRIGSAVVAAGPDRLYPLITAGTSELQAITV